MKRIDIDFSPRHWRVALLRAGLSELLLLSLLILLVIIGVPAVNAMRDRALAAESKLDLQRANAERSSRVVAPASAPISTQVVVAANEAISQLNLPWKDLYQALERSTPRRIALLSIEPDAARRLLKLEAQSSSPEGMLDYLGSLRKDAFFSSVALVRHEVDDTSTSREVRFVIEATWKEQVDE